MLVLLACTDTPVAPASEVAVRGGVLLPVGAQAAGHDAGRGLALAGGWRFVARAPQAGSKALPSCQKLASWALGDVARLVAAGGAAPDTDLAFSPDGRRLAVGTYRGEVCVYDVATGDEIGCRQTGEGMVRRVAWAPDGGTLYAGEQSPDAMLRALDPATLNDRWTLRLADRVGSSPLPAGEDLYGIYTLPGIYGLEVLPGGDVLVAAAHGWSDESGRRLNRSALVRLQPDGSIAAHWPLDADAVDAIVQHPAFDHEGNALAVPITRSASGEAPAGLPIGGMMVLDASNFAHRASLQVPPLAPWFKSTFLWEAHGVDIARERMMLGLGDGRVVLADLEGTMRTVIAGGSPVLAGDVPIAASVGHGLLVDGTAIFLTSGTNIPWGAASPELRPPSPHPDENTLHAYELDGTARWRWHGAWELEGLTLGPDRRTLVVGAGDRRSDSRRDLYGALVFDLGGEPGQTGDDRLQTVCRTEGPVYFRQAVSVDGVIAVAETPYRTEDGGVAGEYRVTIFR